MLTCKIYRIFSCQCTLVCNLYHTLSPAFIIDRLIVAFPRLNKYLTNRQLRYCHAFTNLSSFQSIHPSICYFLNRRRDWLHHCIITPSVQHILSETILLFTVLGDACSALKSQRIVFSPYVSLYSTQPEAINLYCCNSVLTEDGATHPGSISNLKHFNRTV